MIGTKLAHYEITAHLGSGGMGDVYQATDSKLGRIVAIKLLPEAFTDDAERAARFEREARILASLNHPNIAAIYGFEKSAGRNFLAMELVPGDTLGLRIKRGPIPLDETLGIAQQICEALEAAHEKGIIHRDLKPANIKITAGGKVKVLDFGLAKVLNDDTSNAALSLSPTMLSAASMPGVILGTAAYMSPEQARGKPVDKRSDVWAFGVVLFEMLSGAQPFGGDTVADILAKVVYKDPEWQELPAATPPPIVRLLRRCLAKDVRQRFHDISDVRIEIEAALQEPAVEPAPAAFGQNRKTNRQGPMVVFALIGGLLIGAVAMRWLPQRTDSSGIPASPPGPTSHTLIDLMEAAPLALGTNTGAAGFDGQILAISPQGTYIAYVGQSSRDTMLYLRAVESTEVRPLAGTEGATQAFFSPDGQWIGFLTNDKLKKLSLQGGVPITLCDARNPLTGWWIQNDVIYFSDNQGAGISRVSSDGGVAKRVLTADAIHPATAWRRRFSDVLPDGKYVIVTAKPHGISDDFSDIEIVSLETHEAKTLVRPGYGARYVSPGYLLFARGGSLMAVRFNAGRQQAEGQPVSIVPGVSMESLFGQVQAVASSNGLLAFIPGGDRTIGKLAWVDRKGRSEFLPAPEKVYGVVSISPDGRRLAAHVADVTDYIWIFDIEHAQGKKLNGTESQGWPVWGPDNRNIAFASIGEKLNIFLQNVNDGSAPRLIASGEDGYPSSWSPDAQTLFLNNLIAGRFLRLNQEPKAIDADGASLATFSTNGHWLFYVSSQTGKAEIWVRSYPDGKSPRQISIDGGNEPVWCRCGELFYRKGNQWYSSKVTTAPELRWETPRAVFQTEFIDTPGTSYDISPDGQRLLVVKRAVPDVQQKLHLVTNWTRAFERSSISR